MNDRRRLILLCVITLLPVGFAAAENCLEVVADLSHPYSIGWGIDQANHRLQHDTQISRDNVGSLELAWVYGLSSDKPRSWPLVTKDTIFIGDTGNGVVALDRDTGRSPHEGEIGSAILMGKVNDQEVLIYTDRSAGLFAVDARDGKPIWHGQVDDQPVPLYSGTPLIHEDLVLVPISSAEIGLPLNPFYGCCTTSGGMAALSLADGQTRWFRPTIQTPPVRTGGHWLLVDEYGPSGAPVWGSPTLDRNRGLIYFGTGQNYSQPTTDTSDAIFAVEVQTGEVRWHRQFTSGDAYNLACDVSSDHPNCPKPSGPDVDFGAPPVLVRSQKGEDLVIAGQKSGEVHAMRPEDGALVWSTRVGRGGALGGVHWGLAANEALGLVFVPISDVAARSGPGAPRPGLFALDIATGEIRWERSRTARCADRVCAPGLSAAITATRDLVFAGSLDGFLEAYDANTGEVLWRHDAWRGYAAINGVPAEGGAFDAHGPMIAGDQLIISSGYNTFGQKGGNALVAFRLPGSAP